MKNLLLLPIILLTSYVTIGQNTSQEELNFMFKGYKQMVESGLDMKKGYYLTDSSLFTIQNRTYLFLFMNMRRIKDKSLAGTIVIAKSGASGKTYYLGIPAPYADRSIDLSQSLIPQITSYAWDTSIKTAFIQSLAEYLMVINTSYKRASGIY